MKKWMSLGLSILAIAVFIWGLTQLQERNAALQKLAKEVEAQSLEADALFYSESPKAVEAAFLMQQRVQGN